MYSHNSLYYYISYHSPTTCKSLECLGFESLMWIVVNFSSCQHHPHFTRCPFMGDIFFIHILSLIFQHPFLSLACFVTAPLQFHASQILPSYFIPNCEPISVRRSAHWNNCFPTSLAFPKSLLLCLLQNKLEHA